MTSCEKDGIADYMRDLGFHKDVIPNIIAHLQQSPIYLHDNSYCLNYLRDPRLHDVPHGDYIRITVSPHIVFQMTALEIAAVGAIAAQKLKHLDMEAWNTVIRLRAI